MERMTYPQWARSIRPKVAGSWNLHKQFNDLSFFTMLSSIVGVVGNASQTAYGGGNAFQDALAKHRVSLGLPAASLDLGAVTDVGYAAEAKQVINNVGKLGTMPMDMGHVMRLIELSIREPMPSVDSLEESQSITCISPWEVIPDGALIKSDKRFSTLRFTGNHSGVDDASKANSITALKQAVINQSVSREEATPLITSALAEKLAETFNLIRDDMDLGLPLSSFGVDSLVAVELRTWLSSNLKAVFSIFEILQSPSLTEFGALAASKSELFKIKEEM